MCCPDVSHTSTFLIGLMCLTAFSSFAETSADFSGRGEVPILSGAGGLLMGGSSYYNVQEQLRESVCEQIWDIYV